MVGVERADEPLDPRLVDQVEVGGENRLALPQDEQRRPPPGMKVPRQRVQEFRKFRSLQADLVLAFRCGPATPS